MMISQYRFPLLGAFLCVVVLSTLLVPCANATTVRPTNYHIYEGVGLITDLNLENRSIQIGQTVYRLSDKVRVYSSNGLPYNEGALDVGQNIEYGFADEQQPTGPKGELQTNRVIKKVRIQTGFKDSYTNS